MSDYDDNEDYEDYNHDDNNDYDDYYVDEEMKTNDNKVIFGQSHQIRLVKDYLFCNEIKESIKSVQDTLGISSGKALWLLQKVFYELPQAQNPTQKLIDEVYASQKQVQKTGECILCCSDQNIFCLDCNHEFCKDCWGQYLESGIKQGCEFALVKKCPMDKCKQIVDIEFFKKFLKDSSYKMYELFLCQDFMARNKKAISCPGKKCENIIVLNTFKGSLNSFDEAFFNVLCECTCSFCSLCRDEAHRPLNCQKMKEWQSLIGGKSSESIDQLWIKLNTKKCPKCKVDIEKNQGCMHMTCKKCTYEFCWLCMGDWKNHVDCNKYSEIHKKEQDDIKQKSESELKRFQFFSERFINHKKSIEFAIAKKKRLEQSYEEIRKSVDSVISFEFLNDALLTILECRRAVAFSYPLAYYISPNKRNLVEFLQKDLESNLEKLDHLSDKKLESYLNKNQRMMENDFFIFQRDIKNLTQVLSSYFGKMIDSFEKEMPELSKGPSYKENEKNKKGSNNNNSNSNNNNMNTKNSNKRGKDKKQQENVEQVEEEDIPKWDCDYCLHKNPMGNAFCENCFNDRR